MFIDKLSNKKALVFIYRALQHFSASCVAIFTERLYLRVYTALL
jgi:hypothetical protein